MESKEDTPKNASKEGMFGKVINFFGFGQASTQNSYSQKS